jgi:AraC-like DNA-binding protein
MNRHRGRLSIDVAKDRLMPLGGDPAQRLPGWGLLRRVEGCEIHLHPPIAYTVHYRVPLWVAIFPFNGASTLAAIGDGAMQARRISPERVRLMPPETRVRVRQEEPIEFLAFGWNAEHFTALADRVARGRWTPATLLDVADPPLRAMCCEVRRTLIAEPLVPEAWLSGLTDLIAVRLATRWLSDIADETDAPERLAPHMVRRLEARIDAMLGGSIRVADLAAEAGLSRAHFSRAFASSVGVSPRDYILGRRVARARELLIETGASLTEIASVCGFSNPSHFTTAFQKEIGTSPSAYRRALTRRVD